MNEAISTCAPAVTNKDLGVEYSWTGKKLVPEAIASPCGLIAKSYFTGNNYVYIPYTIRYI